MEREEWVGLSFQEWGLVWASAGDSNLKTQGQEMGMEKGG